MSSLQRDIFRLAIPSVLANITIPLVGLVDTAIAGHLASAEAIGGIAVGTMIFDLIYWNFGFLRIGTGGMTAQAVGAGRETDTILSKALSTAWIGALGIWVLQWLLVSLALLLIPASEEVETFAREYFNVRVWAAPATLSLFALKGWFIGRQDTVSPMVTDIVVNVVNIVVSYGLAVYTDLGVLGVAYGTLIAQWTGFVLAGMIALIRYRVHLKFLQPDRQMLRLNIHLFQRSLCFMVVYVGYTILASTYGNTDLALSSILMKLFMLVSFLVDGFAYAGEALVGKEWGSVALDRKSRIDQTVRALFLDAMVVAVLFMVVFGVWGMDLCGLITNDADILAAAADYRWWMMLFPLLATPAFMWDGIYTGACAGSDIRNAMIWAAVGFAGTYAVGTMVELAFALPHTMSWLMAAYFAHLVGRVGYLSFRWKEELKVES